MKPATAKTQEFTLGDVPLGQIDMEDDTQTEADDLDGPVADLRRVRAEGEAKGEAWCGIRTPVTVGPADGAGRYRLIYGRRRVLAARLAGLETIPALVENGGAVVPSRETQDA